jgi:putative transposon-encoded protein
MSPGQREEEKNKPRGSVKFVVLGEEVVDKIVRQSGNSGRVYLPPTWVGKKVKIVRVD